MIIWWRGEERMPSHLPNQFNRNSSKMKSPNTSPSSYPKQREGYVRSLYADYEIENETRKYKNIFPSTTDEGYDKRVVNCSWKKYWSFEAEEYLIKVVGDTDRDDDWAAVARQINSKGLLYHNQSNYGDVTKQTILVVKPMHCMLYYDRCIRQKYPNEWRPPPVAKTVECSCSIS